MRLKDDKSSENLICDIFNEIEMNFLWDTEKFYKKVTILSANFLKADAVVLLYYDKNEFKQIFWSKKRKNLLSIKDFIENNQYKLITADVKSGEKTYKTIKISNDENLDFLKLISFPLHAFLNPETSAAPKNVQLREKVGVLLYFFSKKTSIQKKLLNDTLILQVFRILGEFIHATYQLSTNRISSETGMLSYQHFVNLLNWILSIRKIEKKNAVLAVTSLNLLWKEGNISYLAHRKKVLKTLGNFLKKHYPALQLLTVDEKNEIYLFSDCISKSQYITYFEELFNHITSYAKLRRFFKESKAGIAVFSDHAKTGDELIFKARQSLSWFNSQKSKNNSNREARVVLYKKEMSKQSFVEKGFFWTKNFHLNFRNTGLLLESIAAMDFTKNYIDIETSIVDMAIEVTGAERGILLMINENKQLKFERGRLSGKRNLKSMPDISRSIPAKVLKMNSPISFVTMDDDIALKPGKSIQLLKLRSVMCTPLVMKGKTIGVLYVDSKKHKNEFAETDLIFFHALGKQMGTVMEVASLIAENKEKQEQIARLNKKLQKKIELQSYRMIDMEKELASNQSRLKEKYHPSNIVGTSVKMREVYNFIDRIASYNFPVLIEGESGTGKELVARAIHSSSKQKTHRFVSENCGAIPETLFEAELFGYQRGAFTGADRDKIGLIMQANGGTLFLDEVANMSDAMQKGLLRVIQEKEVRPLGSKKTYKVDVRIICSSNIPLINLVNQNQFRHDLFYRLNVINIQLPPLRERREDIPLLIKHFIEQIAKETGEKIKKVNPEVLEAFAEYDWPGNVRELENEVRRLYIMGDKELLFKYCSSYIKQRVFTQPLVLTKKDHLLTIKDQEKELIISVLNATKGVKKKAAKMLGISRTNLYQKIAKYNIKINEKIEMK